MFLTTCAVCAKALDDDIEAARQCDEDGRHDIKYAFSEKTNDMMLALIDATTKENQVVVTATGTPIAAADAGVVNARNLAFDMFDASMLVMDGEIVSHTGFVIDLFCWDMPGHVAIDGADLDTSPKSSAGTSSPTSAERWRETTISTSTPRSSRVRPGTIFGTI